MTTIMEVTQKQPTLIDLAVAVAPWIHIKNVRLVRSAIESKHEGFEAPVKLAHGFDAITTLDMEAKRLCVRTSLTVAAGDVLHVSADFILDYSLIESPVGITEEAADAFGKMNGIHNVWPYWREYVQSVSTRVGFPPLTLPLVTGASLLEYYKAKDADASIQKDADAQETTDEAR
jgi:hypothetical protein